MAPCERLWDNQIVCDRQLMWTGCKCSTYVHRYNKQYFKYEGCHIPDK